MANLEKFDVDSDITLKKIDEINEHIGYIKGLVEMWIRLTPQDNVMWKVFSDAKNRLDRIKSLNEDLYWFMRE